MIKIVTDSTCDLTRERVKELDIQVVPLSIQANGETYLDGVDLSPEEFVDLLAISSELPRSSQPSVGSFQQVYEQLEAQHPGVQILSIHMTSKMSGTFQSAELAASNSQADVMVVDSEYISGALAFQVEEAANMAKAGKPMGAIITRLQEIRDQSHLYIMLDTLEYLAKGGRIGKGKALIGSLLKVKPLAFLEEGQLSPIKNMRTHKQVIEYLVDGFTKAAQGKTIKKVSISHIEAEGLATRLFESLKKAVGDFPCVINVTSPIISTHTGPGAIALMYHIE
ncbi:DegV family protein [Alkalicoccobacillus porphyridii]|uniref:DegV family protein n=1 Tax=Alkalicoccobacillus porphyridii TaxID=2597270 RepID=A0A553ZUJ2_9BACI|nr:DegV family protein [Alkalicoccobacillus porphyridii]TSB45102.1 DegV family protein [Alkalicoccobacillus porphyridii]